MQSIHSFTLTYNIMLPVAPDSGGPKRGMNMQSKVHLVAIAQGEDDADQRELDRSFAAVTQRIATTKTLLDVHMTLMSNEADALKKEALQTKIMAL